MDKQARFVALKRCSVVRIHRQLVLLAWKQTHGDPAGTRLIVVDVVVNGVKSEAYGRFIGGQRDRARSPICRRQDPVVIFNIEIHGQNPPRCRCCVDGELLRFPFEHMRSRRAERKNRRYGDQSGGDNRRVVVLDGSDGFVVGKSGVGRCGKADQEGFCRFGLGVIDGVHGDGGFGLAGCDGDGLGGGMGRVVGVGDGLVGAYGVVGGLPFDCDVSA